MNRRDDSRGVRLLRFFGLHPVAHRPPLDHRVWIYSATAYLLPVVVHVALPGESSSLDEIVWLVTLVPAFLLSLRYGLKGAFVALLVGTTLVLGVQLFLVLVGTPGDSRITVPIYIAYGALAISVGWLSEQLHHHYEYTLELQAAQKTEALGTMAAGIAHDFNNILTAIVASAELMGDDPSQDPDTRREELDHLKAAARRGAGIVRNLLGFSRRGMLALRPLDLARLVEEERPLLLRLAPEPIHLQFESDGSPAPVHADREAVERILVNLVTNARDAMPFGGTVEVAVRRDRLDRDHYRRTGWGVPGEYICLSVSDTGTGMDDQTLSRIFEPFFTGKAPGEGVGLGMAMVYGLMKQHRGFVDVQSAPGEGTTVRTYFPEADAWRLATSSESEDRPAGGLETLLLVEDEEAIRRAAGRILERHGYRVIMAADGDEAVQVYWRHADEVSLVVTDVMLPKRTGPEAYQAMRSGDGRPGVLFMSGYPANAMHDGGGLDPSLPFLQKPWTADELLAAVRAALDGSPQRRTGTRTESSFGR